MSDISKIFDYLKTNPNSTSSSICQKYDFSQSKFSRLVKPYLGHKILQIGKARTTTYLLIKELDKINFPISIYEISNKGTSSLFGELYYCYPRSFYFKSAIESLNKFYDDLPFFINDLRPSGFLGRLLPKQFPELNLPENVSNWSSIDCLQFLVEKGSDTIGNLVFGEEALSKALSSKNNSNILSNSNDYLNFSNDILRYGIAGSSAAGEQAKFIDKKKDNKNVLVKFSPTANSSISQRIFDLLILEHIANKTLIKNNKKACNTNLKIYKNICFLEIERFDRCGESGRRGVISINSIDAEYLGLNKSWVESGEELLKKGIINLSDYHEIIFRSAFSKLIANTDTHFGNLSFFFENGKVNGLTPFYDILPMAYAPKALHLIDYEFKAPIPDPKFISIWKLANKIAVEFWKTAILNKDLSEDFNSIANSNLSTLVEFESFIKKFS